MSKLPLTPQAVAEIVAIIDGSGYDRLDIKTEAFRLRLQRESGKEDQDSGWSQDWMFSEAEAPAGGDKVAAVAELPDGLLGVAAPLPGTFYRSPQPGAPAFVEVGDLVSEDTVVGIIETMKLMNPVHAGCAGKVEAILVENGEMLEGGATIVHVRPD